MADKYYIDDYANNYFVARACSYINDRARGETIAQAIQRYTKVFKYQQFEIFEYSNGVHYPGFFYKKFNNFKEAVDFLSTLDK